MLIVSSSPMQEADSIDFTGDERNKRKYRVGSRGSDAIGQGKVVCMGWGQYKQKDE